MLALGHVIHSACSSVNNVFQYIQRCSLFVSSFMNSSNLCINNLDCRLSRWSTQASKASRLICFDIFLSAVWFNQLMSIGILTISDMFLTTKLTHSSISLAITKKSADIRIGMTVETSSCGLRSSK